jgi:hypothetical protein
MKNYILACAIAACVAVVGCTSFEHKTTTTSPTGTGVTALMGTWTSATASAGAIPAASTCTDFKWIATEQTATTAKGSFSATCAGGLKVAGTASGTLTGATTIDWTANGLATIAGTDGSCPIMLTGTAELGANSIRVPYSGTTCAGPVSGVEVLNKK